MHGSTTPVLLLLRNPVVVLVVWVDAWCPVIGTKCHDGWSGCERSLLFHSFLGGIVHREKQSHPPTLLLIFPLPSVIAFALIMFAVTVHATQFLNLHMGIVHVICAQNNQESST